jgi:hypothetical protein
MKKSFTTWRLGFISVPTKELLDNICTILEPIDRVEKPEDYGMIFREYGISDHLFIEPEAELTAGEIALNCLVKAHRLGKGWSIMWPGLSNTSKSGWSYEDLERFAIPDCLDGLTGGFNQVQHFAQSFFPEIESAIFTVTVITEAEKQPKPFKEKSELKLVSQFNRMPSIDMVEFDVYVKPAIQKIIAWHRLFPWSWDLDKTKTQLERFGYSFNEEGYEEFVYQSTEGATAKIKMEDDSVLWIEFILLDYQNPHLLDEVEFTQKQNQFEALFHNSVNHIEMFFGSPSFIGASGDIGFPDDQWAEWLALWTKDNYKIMIEAKHNDKEMPLELCLVFAPEE